MARVYSNNNSSNIDTRVLLYIPRKNHTSYLSMGNPGFRGYQLEFLPLILVTKPINLHLVEYYFVWVAVDFLSSILWFFFGVETAGRTIEELDACFESKFPPRASWRRTKIVRDENNELKVKVAGFEA